MFTFSSSPITPSWFSWLSLSPASSWVALLPLLPLASVFLPSLPPPLIVRTTEKLEPVSRRGKSEAACPAVSFPWLGKYLRERALGLPGRGQCVQSKLALSQRSLSVEKLGQVWPKAHSKSSSGIRVYSFSPSTFPREPRRPDKLFPQRDLIRVA